MNSQSNIDRLLQSLTLDEKVSLLAGGSIFGTAGIPEKGVPSIKLIDGPNGVRGASADGSTAAACFPAACSIAATFDIDLARKIGHALAEEALSKNAHCILGPTMCIHRHPLGGRNFESFSEDPFLSGKLASQTIQGIQSLEVGATVKHFVANEQETARLTVNEIISERALREIYLRPFEIAIKEAQPWAVMTAYNQINGTHCDSNRWLLNDVLRGEWKWEGLVMSDWGGTNSVSASIKAGLDLEMPGPPRIRKADRVLEALRKRDINEGDINERARAILTFIEKAKVSERSAIPLGLAIDKPEHRALIREAGARGIVLLKNERSLLPISKEKLKGKKIAMIGFAKDALAHGGGSAAVNAHYKITPWNALQTTLSHGVQMTYAKGVHRERLLKPIEKDGDCGKIMGLDGQPGFTRLYFEEDSPAPTSVLHGFERSAYSPLGSQESIWKHIEIVGHFTPRETGTHYIACSGVGPTKVLIDGNAVFEQDTICSDPMGAFFGAAQEQEIKVFMSAEKSYYIQVISSPPRNVGVGILEGRTGVRMGFALESEHDADLIGDAVRIAKEADLAIVFTGHDPQWETEGLDQESFHLPCKGSQDALVSAVARANQDTIVVNSTGVAVAMPWINDVAAVLQAWFPGQECGNAIVDVLTGKINPEGHLPVSFPRKLEDAPAHGNFPGEYIDNRLHVKYAEGIFVGYRHFDRMAPDSINFPFGHGLSYTTFDFPEMAVKNQTENAFDVLVDVKNTGAVAGATILQIYVGRSKTAQEHPIKSLVAFSRVYLHPGETKTVQLSVSIREIAYFSEDLQQWIIDGGDYDVSLGRSAVDIAQVRVLYIMQTSYARSS
ncbi:glycoside hydrolase family 3 protein [Bipolaris maydis ATCC 48331]|uniref:beta-glucosidase n=2 Tax=Cochliobolus heterostrophus TaxID=5016 RepID=M2ULB2_COCH5|nr:glycoside hydrolase family 3 protein [Bipolaris maydis ATCC 48331]EMD94381.1 glycoside hydrolase family 3 protein [Bipolaris maydis C5]KAJ5026462.1 glycoside hydrolase [Bipolaris maydis]ENI01279.1 glycoside hydrolase family 3 protein [Bipolaris maydis ATCC 48331]KAJ6197221.1 glycoside hydrolase superfamily [Bipolaris maydis]KAJ6209806.1 glycoside hydrolase family 3 protein [Bipolaris maydis]